LHKQGLARFATQKYDSDDMAHYAHLTNYAVNKKNADFKISQ
jgi:hypothetical protein